MSPHLLLCASLATITLSESMVAPLSCTFCGETLLGMNGHFFLPTMSTSGLPFHRFMPHSGALRLKGGGTDSSRWLHTGDGVQEGTEGIMDPSTLVDRYAFACLLQNFFHTLPFEFLSNHLWTAAIGWGQGGKRRVQGTPQPRFLSGNSPNAGDVMLKCVITNERYRPSQNCCIQYLHAAACLYRAKT